MSNNLMKCPHANEDCLLPCHHHKHGHPATRSCMLGCTGTGGATKSACVPVSNDDLPLFSQDEGE